MEESAAMGADKTCEAGTPSPFTELGDLDEGTSTGNEEGDISPAQSESPDDPYIVPACCQITAFQPIVYLVLGGAPPKLRARQWTLLLIVCVAGVFNMYDWEVFPMALETIQKELNVSESYIGIVGSVIRGGQAMAIFMGVVSDVWGRRFAFVSSILLYTLFSVASVS